MEGSYCVRISRFGWICEGAAVSGEGESKGEGNPPGNCLLLRRRMTMVIYNVKENAPGVRVCRTECFGSAHSTCRMAP